MTRFSVPARADADHAGSSLRPAATPPGRRGTDCDLYAPGHQMHYRHQGEAVRSRSLPARATVVDDTLVLITLEDGRELQWRHHDPERLRRIIESVPGKRVLYPDAHALRVGPYWFNCARASDDWQDCRSAEPEE
jgi:hypothetical protein